MIRGGGNVIAGHGGSGGLLAPALGERLVVGVLIVHGDGLEMSRTRGGASTPVVFEFCRRLEVGLLAGSRSGGGRRLVDAEGELHTVQRTVAVLVGFTLALPLESALLDNVSGMVAFEARGLKLFDAPIV